MLRVAIVVLCSICLMYSHDEIDAQSDTSDITNGKIAFASNRDGNYEIYTMASDGSDVQRLTFNEGGDFDPDWSPDGTKIAFSSQQDIVSDIIIMDSDGSNQINLTNNPDGGDLYPSWSPDGTKIAFSR
ncbi:MAG: translocation protein TolB, partial [Chloroflexota bacterium]